MYYRSGSLIFKAFINCNDDKAYHLLIRCFFIYIYLLRRIMDRASNCCEAIRTHISFIKYEKRNV